MIYLWRERKRKVWLVTLGNEGVNKPLMTPVSIVWDGGYNFGGWLG